MIYTANQCFDDLLITIQSIIYQEICIQTQDNDFKISIQGKDTQYNIEFNVMDKSHWNEMYYVNNNQKILCRYLATNTNMKSKLCIELAFDIDSNAITKINKISHSTPQTHITSDALLKYESFLY
eukprot:TRINITY_DN6139_c0_g1_i1.p1 TRINITY_DN6139_c0_g1~~TRINITY_DN6139_c0_g1_i1.p1  ORF type:complete len:125 (+),score=25.78 TRINITY_DN6139_c0_g1_i1:81-455(+)